MTARGMWKAIIVGVAVMAVVLPHSDTVFGSTGTWSAKAPMPTPRFGHGVGVVNGILYAVGGVAGIGLLNTVEVYDPGADTWSTKAPMPTARTDLGVGVVNGILSAVGGAAGIGVLNTVETYDPSANIWSTDAPMPTARQGLGIGAVDGALYAVGGYGGTAGTLGTNEEFAPAAPVVAFAAFRVKVDIAPSAQAFDVRGRFTLGAGSAINPLTDSLTVQVGAASVTIPGGSFELYGDDGFRINDEELVYVVFKVLDGVPVEGIIVPLGGNRFAFEIGAVGVPGLPGTNPVTVRLTIGQTTGSASVDASFETDD